MTDEELKFDNLFKKHLAEWPEVISLELHDEECVSVTPTEHGYDLIKYKKIPWEGNREIYVVSNLDSIERNIAKKYYGKDTSIIWGTLGWVVRGIIWSLAYYVSSIKTSDFRMEVVRGEFEDDLRDHINKAKSYGWTVESTILARRYFKVNGVPIRKRKPKTEK